MPNVPGAIPLTTYEREVVALLATGRTTKFIARLMQLAPKMVDRQIKRCLQKLGARNRSELIAKAIALGEVSNLPEKAAANVRNNGG